MTETIMIVDDSRTMRDMLKRTLEGSGYKVIEAVDGRNGIEILEKLAEPPSAIITDLNMPHVDGYGFLVGARRRKDTEKTPILVLTTETSAEKKQKAKDSGATGWIVKPFDSKILLSALSRVIS